ncbi:MAG: Antitoxin YafN [Candidatus Celerinatantimonas neptuna]|nr:MAG: Antitoxin YafN [Candidatus Celerinatantimonas neptuna]
MAVQSIFARKTVSVTEMRKNPTQFFIEEPVAVLSNNKTAGYMVSKEMFEQMITLLEAQSGQFSLSQDRLNTIAKTNANLLANASLNELGEFSE